MLKKLSAIIVSALALVIAPSVAWAAGTVVEEAIWPGFDTAFVNGADGIPNAEPVTLKAELSGDATNFGYFYVEFSGTFVVDGSLGEKGRTVDSSGDCKNSQGEVLFSVTSNLADDAFDGRECTGYSWGGGDGVGFGFGVGDPFVAGVTDVTIVVPVGRILQIDASTALDLFEVTWNGGKKSSTGVNFLTPALSEEEDSGSSDVDSRSDSDSNVTPGIHLNLLAGVGDSAAGAQVEIAGVKLRTGSGYTLTLRSDPMVLADDVVGSSAAMEEIVFLPAGLAPGAHSLTLTAQTEDGTNLTLVQRFSVGADGRFASVDSPEGSVVAVTGETLARTGAPESAVLMGLTSAAALLLIGVALLRLRPSRVK